MQYVKDILRLVRPLPKRRVEPGRWKFRKRQAIGQTRLYAGTQQQAMRHVITASIWNSTVMVSKLRSKDCQTA